MNTVKYYRMHNGLVQVVSMEIEQRKRVIRGFPGQRQRAPTVREADAAMIAKGWTRERLYIRIEPPMAEAA